MEKNVNANHYDDEIDLKELFLVLWAADFFSRGHGGVCCFICIYVLSISNQYKAVVLLAPAQSDGGGLSSALGQLGGLASLAGVSLGEGISSEAQIAQEILQSWGFVETFIEKNDLAIPVYAAQGWDAVSGELEINDDIYDVSENQWLLTDEETGEFRPPSSWELFERFSDILSVTEDRVVARNSINGVLFSADCKRLGGPLRGCN